MASALALQIFTNWAMKTHTLGAGQFGEIALTRERNKTLHEGNVNCGKTSVNLRYDRHGCYNNFSKQLQEWPKEISGFKRDSSPLPAR